MKPSNSLDNFILSSIESNPQTTEEFLALKKKLSKQLRIPLPTNADIREHYDEMVAEKKIARNKSFETVLRSRNIRTQSGVAVVAVLTKPYPCPGKCLYCPTEKDMPKSYLSNEPAVMRAIACEFDPYKQVRSRLRSLELNGHETDKIELIVMGGTFSYLPKPYQKKFISECFRACNEGKCKMQKSKWKIKEGLFVQQKKNETSSHRIIGITLETRPDYIDEEEVLNFRRLGCTRVELGVQSVYDSVLEKNKREHTASEVARATKLLKDAGFKVGYHIMPGLPGSTLEKDYKMFQILFQNPDFQPDLLKIYPTVVIKNSALYTLWKNGKYAALTDEEFKTLVCKVKQHLIPPYTRISRLVRDVPSVSIIAGPTVSNLRQLIARRVQCPCIRCREVRENYHDREEIVLQRIEYDSSDGKEIFLQYVSPDAKKLFALLRLRIPEHNNARHYIPDLRNAALIREVHTYGKLAKLHTHTKESPQHIGLGRKLLEEAERITREEFSLKKIAVISGVGVRDYYRKLGYRLRDGYMLKNLKLNC